MRFLTGHSTRFLPAGTTAYTNNSLTESYSSIVSHLKDLGYETVAMHPHLEYAYARNTVYPQMGFDNMLFIQDFPREK